MCPPPLPNRSAPVSQVPLPDNFAEWPETMQRRFREHAISYRETRYCGTAISSRSALASPTAFSASRSL